MHLRYHWNSLLNLRNIHPSGIYSAFHAMIVNFSTLYIKRNRVGSSLGIISFRPPSVFSDTLRTKASQPCTILAKMKSLLPLIAIGLIGGCCAADKFKLPPFRLFDKNNDGTFEAKEVGPLMIDAAKVVTQVAGKKLFKLAGMAIPEMRDGKLTKEEYKEIEDQIRTRATALLKELREHAPEVKGKIEVMQWLMRVNSLLMNWL